MPNFFEGPLNMIESFMHPEKGYEEAEKQFRNAWEQAQGREQPFVDQGQAQYGRLNQASQDLLDPQTLLNKWMQSYEMSPYAKQSLGNAQSSGLNAASAQGLLGSSAATQNIQNSASDIMNKDRSEFLKDLMQKYLSGIGVSQNLYGTGANMAGQLGNQGMDFGKGMGELAFGRQNAPGNLLEQLIRLGTNIYGAGAGGAAGQGASSIGGQAALSAAA